MSKTKEELQKVIGGLEAIIDRLNLANTHIRKEFAKAFHWESDRTGTFVSTDYRDPSWEEIFTHVGGLLENKNYTDLGEKFEALDIKFSRIEEIQKGGEKFYTQNSDNINENK